MIAGVADVARQPGCPTLVRKFWSASKLGERAGREAWRWTLVLKSGFGITRSLRAAHVPGDSTAAGKELKAGRALRNGDRQNHP
jgi:hypothetical protein